MKSLNLVFILSFFLLSVANVFGQAINEKDTRNSLKNKLSYEPSNIQQRLGNEYSFSKTTGIYSDLVGAVSINQNQLWDDPEYIIPIGFDFELYDLTIDSLYFGIGFGGSVSSKLDLNYEAEYIILPFETDLIDRGDLTGTSQSPISYELEGTPGDRVLKLEWKNAGFYDEADSLGTLNDYISFQLWLFEGSNDIEIHFGPNMITNPRVNYFGQAGALIGLTDLYVQNAYLLSGNPANPTLVDFLDFLNGTPTDGTIYKFSRTTTGVYVDNSQGRTHKVYPNPTNGLFTVEGITSENGNYQITDIAGKVIQQGKLTDNSDNMDISDILNGVYFITIGNETYKLIKQ